MEIKQKNLADFMYLMTVPLIYDKSNVYENVSRETLEKTIKKLEEFRVKFNEFVEKKKSSQKDVLMVAAGMEFSSIVSDSALIGSILRNKIFSFSAQNDSFINALYEFVDQQLKDYKIEEFKKEHEERFIYLKKNLENLGKEYIISDISYKKVFIQDIFKQSELFKDFLKEEQDIFSSKKIFVGFLNHIKNFHQENPNITNNIVQEAITLSEQKIVFNNNNSRENNLIEKIAIKNKILFEDGRWRLKGVQVLVLVLENMKEKLRENNVSQVVAEMEKEVKENWNNIETILKMTTPELKKTIEAQNSKENRIAKIDMIF